jgi:hypothetical protein
MLLLMWTFLTTTLCLAPPVAMLYIIIRPLLHGSEHGHEYGSVTEALKAGVRDLASFVRVTGQILTAVGSMGERFFAVPRASDALTSHAAAFDDELADDSDGSLEPHGEMKSEAGRSDGAFSPSEEVDE